MYYFRNDLAFVHDRGFGKHGDRCAPGQGRVAECAWAGFRWSDRVASWFGVVLAAGRSGSPEGARGDLLDLPAGVLLEPVVVTAGR
ncbi:MAG TPA: hypothetical protein VHO07_02210, partial [Streptosporangiaceae bacterium]|nr:hypothetical protein [Streptosporangiaceae bacterium]